MESGRPILRVAAVAMVVCALSCVAEDEVRRGAEGEFCNNRDADCRQGLICRLGVCTRPEGGPKYTCEQMCAALRDCEAAAETCVGDCIVTTRDWSLRAVDRFGICMVEGLTCEQARSSDPPQACYERIPIPDGRFETCRSWSESAGTCGVSGFREDCTMLARVGRDEEWESARSRCPEAVDTGDCAQLRSCLETESGSDE